MVHVGDRVLCRRDRGYVRWIGTLPGQDGSWVGIDWDDASRGKHDGSHDGVRYFHAKSPTSASFISAQRVGDGGRVPFASAVAKRVEAAEGAIIKSLDLSRSGAIGPVDCGDNPIDTTLVRHLYVSETLLSDFSDVHRCLDVFPALQSLDVARNRFDEFPQLNPGDSRISPNLRRLDLNGCIVPLDAIHGLCARCPDLEELRLYDVGLTSLRGEVDLASVISSVRVVDLGGNVLPLTDIVETLGALPRLEQLYMVNGSLDGQETIESEDVFPSLVRLSLAGNPLRAWPLITSLALLPSLKHLAATDTPLTEDEGLEYMPNDDRLLSRHSIIGRLPALEKLHGAEISADERRYAEKRYLVAECLPAHRAGRSAEHPRLAELAEMYDLDLSEKSGGTLKHTAVAGTLRADLVNVEWRYGGQCVRKALPRSLEILKLRALTRRFLELPPSSKFRLTQIYDDGTRLGIVKERSLVDLGNEVVLEVALKE